MKFKNPTVKIFLWNKHITQVKTKKHLYHFFFEWIQNSQCDQKMSQCQYTLLNLSCPLLLKIPKLEVNSEYLNFLVCQSMPSPLPIYYLFFFSASSKTISRMNFSINGTGLGRNWGSPPWQNYQEINFFLKLWPCSWLNQGQSQIRKL